MQILPALQQRLFLLNRNAVGVSVGVVADASHLPGDFHSRAIGLNGKSSMADFSGDNRLRELADGGELVAEVAKY